MSNLGKSTEPLFLSTGSKWASELMEYPAQGLGYPMGQGSSSGPRSLPRSIVWMEDARLSINVLCVHLVLTFFQSSRTVPSTLRAPSRLVKLNSRASWRLNEGGWYAVSGREGGAQGTESKFPRRDQGLHGLPTPSPKASHCPFTRFELSTTPDLVRAPSETLQGLGVLIPVCIDCHDTLRVGLGHLLL